MSAQMWTLTEFNESLNQYLKLYCEESKKEVENELSRVKLDYAEKIEKLNEKINEMQEKEDKRMEKHAKQISENEETINSYKVQLETLQQSFHKEKEELEASNKQAIENIKHEIMTLS